MASAAAGVDARASALSPLTVSLTVMAGLALWLAGSWLTQIAPRQSPAFAEPDNPLRHVITGITLNQFDPEGQLRLRGTISRLAQFARPEGAADRYQMEQLALDWLDPAAAGAPVHLLAAAGQAAEPARALTLTGGVSLRRTSTAAQPGWQISGPTFHLSPAIGLIEGEVGHHIEADSGPWRFHSEATRLEVSLPAQQFRQTGRVRDYLTSPARSTPSREHP